MILLLILFVLVVVLAVSLWEYNKEKKRTMEIINSIPFLALIISFFKHDD